MSSQFPIIDRASAEFAKINLQMMAGCLPSPVIITERRTVGPMSGILVEAIGKNGRRVGRQVVAQSDTLEAAIEAANVALSSATSK